MSEPRDVSGLIPRKLELAIAVCYALLIVVGAATKRADVAMWGAIIFSVVLLLDVVRQHRLAKLFAANEPISDAKSIETRVLGWINSCMVLGGLALIFLGGNFPLVGLILWVVPHLAYFVGGLIADLVGGLPLRFGYGGWKVDRRRRK